MIHHALRQLPSLPSAVRFPLLKVWRKKGGSIASALLLGLGSQTLAATPHSAQSAVEQHLRSQLQAQAKQQHWQGLRLSFEHQPHSLSNSSCPEPWRISSHNSDLLARQRLNLHCHSSGQQLELLSQAQVFVQALHASTNIERGNPLGSHNSQLRELQLSKNQREFYDQAQQLSGLEARRRIRTGQLLSPALVKTARVVSRGERVRIIANKDGIVASTMGEALQDGGVGEVIRVRNISSEKTIDTQVLEAGVVTSTW